MKSKFLRTTLAAALFGAFAIGSMQASAATFSFTQHSGFVAASTFSNDVASNTNDIVFYNDGNVPAPVAGDYTTLAWGVPSINNGGVVVIDPFTLGTGPSDRYSGVEVHGFAGSVSNGADPGLYGAWEKISTVWHYNRTIGGNAFTLTNTLIYSELTIGSQLPDANGIPVGFLETMNTAFQDNAANCTDGAPNGSICDDLFSFPSAGLNDIFFSEGGKHYQVDFKIDDFINSVSDFPGCATNAPDCTVWTAEEQTSNLSVFMRIREIPEPSTLALLGLALVGFGVRGRKVS